MVRTSGGIRISAGKSSKKGGGSGGSSRSLPSTPSGKSNNKGSTRLPPIPHCEAPSWQKPITNFFNSDAGSSKNNISEVNQEDHEAGPSRGTENMDINIKIEAVKKTKDTERHSIKRISDDQLFPEKRRKEDNNDKENFGNNFKIDCNTNSMKAIQNEDEECGNKFTDSALTEKAAEIIEESCFKNKENNINDKQLLEKQRMDEEKGKENIDDNTSN